MTQEGAMYTLDLARRILKMLDWWEDRRVDVTGKPRRRPLSSSDAGAGLTFLKLIGGPGAAPDYLYTAYVQTESGGVFTNLDTNAVNVHFQNVSGVMPSAEVGERVNGLIVAGVKGSDRYFVFLNLPGVLNLESDPT